MARAIERSIERATERSSDRAIDRATERSSDRAIDRATERSSDRATERPSDRATERPPSDLATEHPSDRPIERSSDRPSDRRSDRKIDHRAIDRATERSSDRAIALARSSAEGGYSRVFNLRRLMFPRDLSRRKVVCVHRPLAKNGGRFDNFPRIWKASSIQAPKSGAMESLDGPHPEDMEGLVDSGAQIRGDGKPRRSTFRGHGKPR